MIIKVKKNNAFFKKIFLSFITAFSLFIVIGLSNNVSANTNSHVPSSGGGRNSAWKYYGNLFHYSMLVFSVSKKRKGEHGGQIYDAI